MGAKVDVEALHAGEQQLHLCALLRWTQIRRAGAIGLFHLFNQGVPRHFSRPQRPVKVRAGAVLEVRSIDNQPLLVADVQKGPVERSGGSRGVIVGVDELEGELQHIVRPLVSGQATVVIPHGGIFSPAGTAVLVVIRAVTLAGHSCVALCRDDDEIDHPSTQISHVLVSDIPFSLPSAVVNHLAAVAKVVVYEPRMFEVELKVAWATRLSLGRVQQEHKQHAHRLLPKLSVPPSAQHGGQEGM
mmetsp:Transcript_63599/g.153577  ORF Transcript_63599/g.153577 Transcript_63599/m.153577 type:complete len:244 (-) Transcript_63599:130-861(-)